jgi:transformation/transcription domain-associated protein
MVTIYHLIVKQPQLFFPANSLNKLGAATAWLDLHLLSVEILQIIFQWEEQATEARKTQDPEETPKDDTTWLTPLNFRENMVSYLVRLTKGTSDQPS